MDESSVSIRRSRIQGDQGLPFSSAGSHDANLIEAATRLALRLYDIGDWVNSARIEISILETCEHIYTTWHPRTLEAMNALANLCYDQGFYEVGKELTVYVNFVATTMLQEAHNPVEIDRLDIIVARARLMFEYWTEQSTTNQSYPGVASGSGVVSGQDGLSHDS